MPINSLDLKVNRTICVAGASGFLGQATVEEFSRRGFKVIALTRPTSRTLESLPSGSVTQIRGTVDDWVRAIETERPISIFSFDWNGVTSGSRDDRLLQESNLDRVGRLAQAASSFGVKNFISLGSQAEVRPSIAPILENAVDDPQNFYGTAKVNTRKQIQGILEGCETRFIWGRIFTIYGPGDTRNSLITQLIKSLLKNETFTVSEPSKMWSFLEVSDFLEALYLLHESSNISGIVNIGNPIPTTIGEVSEEIGRRFGLVQNVLKLEKEIEVGTQITWIPDTHTLSGLSWRPKIQLSEGLENTIGWWKQFSN